MGISLCDLGARALARLLGNREVSAVEVMTAHLTRIDAWNPVVNAIVGLLPPNACLTLAGAADAMAASGAALGTLHGLPLAFKDLQEVRGLPFTRGSPIFRDARGTADTRFVARIRSAGVLPIGKTNVPEFGLGSHTYNPVWGPTRNPYDPSRSAGGSSGGAAAALATGMLPLADGSDLGGSLRNPANFNNVAALRPTVGLVPTMPDPFPRLGFGVNGPMGRTMDDVAFLLGVVAGGDDHDPGCPPVPAHGLGAPLTGDVGRPLRVAWCPDLGGLPMEPAVRRALAPQRARFVAEGWQVDDVCPDLDGADEAFLTVRRWRSAAVLGPLLETHRLQMKPELIDEIEAGRRLTGADVARALAAQTALVARLALFFDTYDVFVCAVNQVAPFDVALDWPHEVDGVPMRHYIEWMQSTYWISVTGAPAVSVPVAFTDTGLPVGLQIVGRPWDDRRLLELAHRIEHACGSTVRRPVLPH